MKAGKLDKTITIETASTTADSFGEPIESWSTLATVPATVLSDRGSERFQNQQVIGTAVKTFRIRWRSDVTVKNRIVYDSRNWDIRDVREIGRREGLEIDASARAE